MLFRHDEPATATESAALTPVCLLGSGAPFALPGAMSEQAPACPDLDHGDS